MNAKTDKKSVAIVTGASTGMGLRITRALLERGYRVVAYSRTISRSKDLKPSADLVLVAGFKLHSKPSSVFRDVGSAVASLADAIREFALIFSAPSADQGARS